MDTLADALPREIERVQGIIKEYEQIPEGAIAASLMRQDIRKAHNAMMSGDLPGMLEAYQALKEYTM